VSMSRQVRKSYEVRRAKRRAQGRGRTWKLARLAVEAADTAEKLGAAGRKAADRDTADMESFLQVRAGPYPWHPGPRAFRPLPARTPNLRPCWGGGGGGF